MIRWSGYILMILLIRWHLNFAGFNFGVSIMKEELLISLINSGIVKEGTEVTILRAGRDIGGLHTVQSRHYVELRKIEVIDNKVYLIALSVLDRKEYQLEARHILQVDGMNPARLSEAFKTDGKKRGRKPNPKRK